MLTKENVQTDIKADHSRLTPRLQLARIGLQLLAAAAPDFSTQLTLSFFLRPRRKRHLDYSALLPEGAQRIEIFHNLTKLTGWTWGTSGPSVLLVHGWEGHTGHMAGLVQPLVEQGFRVVAFDAPGHGLSPNAETHLFDMAETIQDVIEQQGPFHAIVAHSLGATATAVILGEETQLLPEKLVLLSPMRDMLQHVDIFADTAGLSLTRKAWLCALITRRIGRSFKRGSAVNAASHLTLPGLVIHDYDDALISYEVSRAIVRNWGSAQLIATRHLGHHLGLKNREVMSHILDFLGSPISTIQVDLNYAVFEDVDPQLIQWSIF